MNPDLHQAKRMDIWTRRYCDHMAHGSEPSGRLKRATAVKEADAAVQDFDQSFRPLAEQKAAEPTEPPLIENVHRQVASRLNKHDAKDEVIREASFTLLFLRDGYPENSQERQVLANALSRLGFEVEFEKVSDGGCYEKALKDVIAETQRLHKESRPYGELAVRASFVATIATESLRDTA